MRYSRFFFFLVLTIFHCSLLQAQKDFKQEGMCSYYGEKFNGFPTASGEKYNMKALTGAHQQLPFNTLVRVTNLDNQKSVIVKINDRGPYARGRIIDLSKAAAQSIDMIRKGFVHVKIEVVNNAQENTTPVSASSKEMPKDIKTDDNKVIITNEADYKTGKSYSAWGTEKKPKGKGLQVGSYTQLFNARGMCKEMINAGYENVVIQVVTVKKVKIYKVVYGTYAKETEARAYSKILKKAGYDNFLLNHL